MTTPEPADPARLPGPRRALLAVVLVAVVALAGGGVALIVDRGSRGGAVEVADPVPTTATGPPVVVASGRDGGPHWVGWSAERDAIAVPADVTVVERQDDLAGGTVALELARADRAAQWCFLGAADAPGRRATCSEADQTWASLSAYAAFQVTGGESGLGFPVTAVRRRDGRLVAVDGARLVEQRTGIALTSRLSSVRDVTAALVEHDGGRAFLLSLPPGGPGSAAEEIITVPLERTDATDVDGFVAAVRASFERGEGLT